MSDDAERLRGRADDRRTDGPSAADGAPAQLVKVLDPIAAGATLDAGKFFAGRPLTIAGEEREGARAVISEGAVDDRRIVLARRRPVAGSAVVADWVPHRWVAGSQGPDPCAAVDGDLVVHFDYLQGEIYDGGTSARFRPARRTASISLYKNAPCSWSQARWAAGLDASWGRYPYLGYYSNLAGTYYNISGLFDFGGGAAAPGNWSPAPAGIPHSNGLDIPSRRTFDPWDEYHRYTNGTQIGHSFGLAYHQARAAWTLYVNFNAGSTGYVSGGFYFNGSYYGAAYLLEYDAVGGTEDPFSLSFGATPDRVQWFATPPTGFISGHGTPPAEIAARQVFVGQGTPIQGDLAGDAGQVVPWLATPAWGCYGLSITR